ncbi:MAG: DUF1997 domain-containing protein [Chloroflexota bacterium]|nr:DUF1997 domain-containing protein [Chloroflexota bacterium]
MQTAQCVAVQGDFERCIRLETELETAYAYFSDFSYVLPRLPEIDRVLHYSDGRYRMIFGADDGRGHDMGIVFDIRHEFLTDRHIKIHSVPLSTQDLHNDPRLANSKGPLFPGRFSGETLFHKRGNHIEVVYRAELHIEIEIPRFLSFMPRRVVQQLGDGLMNLKLHKVGNGLAERMASDFTEWHSLKQKHTIKTLAMPRSKNGLN